MYNRIISQSNLDTLVTLDEAKAQCRVTHTFDDDYISALIGVAAEMAQSYTNRILTPDTTVTSFVESYQGSQIQLFSGNVTSIDEVVIDDSDEPVEEEDYSFNEITQKLTVSLTYSNLKITYKCGYQNIPLAVKQAMLMTISTLYNSREDFIIGSQVTELPLKATVLLNTVKHHAI